jgi:hypothetical protein
MKSCRNCERSTHTGSWNTGLACFKGQLVQRVSMSTEENQAMDAHLRTVASRCEDYKPEGESE